MHTHAVQAPWYRDRWPWILMSGPAIVIVAGIFTTYLAVVSNDGLVADDYYKQGIAINRVIAREENARALGLEASVLFNETHDRVRVAIAGRDAIEGIPRLTLVHATRAGEDQAVALAPVGPGLYEGSLRPPREGAWRLQLQDARSTWRLTGHWHSAQPGAKLGAGTR